MSRPGSFMYQYGWKRHVNDVVHSFCYRCRNPGSQEPFILIGWEGHAAYYAAPSREIADYKPFLAYAMHHCTGKYQHYEAMIWMLGRFCNSWNVQEFAYAHELMRKYYTTTKTESTE